MTPASVVCNQSVNIFKLLSETIGPIEVKTHMEDGGKTVCSNGSVQMNKTVTMPIYGENSLKIFSRTMGLQVYSIWDVRSSTFIQMILG